MILQVSAYMYNTIILKTKNNRFIEIKLQDVVEFTLTSACVMSSYYIDVQKRLWLLGLQGT